MKKKPDKSAASFLLEKKRGSSRQKQCTRTDADQAVTVANKYMLRHYPLGLLGGAPLHLSIHAAELWIVPVLFTSTGIGVVGLAGTVAVDARTGQVVGSTPAQEVASAVRRLYEEKKDAIQTAFLCAGKR